MEQGPFAGADRRLCSGVIRGSVATEHYCASGGDVLVAESILNHASVRTTETCLKGEETTRAPNDREPRRANDQLGARPRVQQASASLREASCHRPLWARLPGPSLQSRRRRALVPAVRRLPRLSGPSFRSMSSIWRASTSASAAGQTLRIDVAALRDRHQDRDGRGLANSNRRSPLLRLAPSPALKMARTPASSRHSRSTSRRASFRPNPRTMERLRTCS